MVKAVFTKDEGLGWILMVEDTDKMALDFCYIKEFV